MLALSRDVGGIPPLTRHPGGALRDKTPPRGSIALATKLISDAGSTCAYSNAYTTIICCAQFLENYAALRRFRLPWRRGLTATPLPIHLRDRREPSAVYIIDTLETRPPEAAVN
jgi:hypothetical protein